MALPLAPIALTVLKYGGVAATAYGLARSIHKGRSDQHAEDAMDRVDEGISLHRPRDHRTGQVNGTARWRRVVRLGRTGPGVEVDMAAYGRLQFRRV